MNQSSIVQFLFSGYSAHDIVFLIVSALIAGLARGFSGFGAALIFMPLASSVIGPQRAAPVLLLIDAVAALGMLPGAWSKANRRDVGVMTIGALVGVPLGAAALTTVDPLTLRWIIAVTVALLLLFLMSGWRYRGQPAPLLTVGVGGLAGIFGGIAQMSGPPVVAYWLGGAIPVQLVRANIVLYFAVSTVLTIVSYFFGHLFVPAVFGFALVTGPLYAAGLLLGSKLFGKASETSFRWICYGLIASASLVSLPVFDTLLR